MGMGMGMGIDTDTDTDTGLTILQMYTITTQITNNPMKAIRKPAQLIHQSSKNLGIN